MFRAERMIGSQWRPSNLCRSRYHTRLCMFDERKFRKGDNHVDKKEEATRIKQTPLMSDDLIVSWLSDQTCRVPQKLNKLIRVQREEKN